MNYWQELEGWWIRSSSSERMQMILVSCIALTTVFGVLIPLARGRQIP